MGPYLKSYIVIEKKCVPHPHKRTVEVKLLSSSLTTQIYINIQRMLRHPYLIYSDFESILKPFHT
jgi:hypothetical protein